MCGRSRCALAPEEVIARARTNTWENRDLYHPSHNVSPGNATPVVHLDKSGHPIIHTMRWGLVPSFTKPTEKPDFWRMFNARSESIREKPSFRRLVPTRRCLVFESGFFEWKKEEGGVGGGSKKQPYYIHLVNEKTGEEEPMVMAGLYDVWYQENDGGGGGTKNDEDEEIKEEDEERLDNEKGAENKDSSKQVMHTYTILTTESCPSLQWLHDRMPVILKDEAAQQMWLDTTDKSSIDKLHSILGPYTGTNLRWHPVSREMSNPSFQGPEAYKEIKKPSIQNFFQPRKNAAGKTTEAGGKRENSPITQQGKKDISEKDDDSSIMKKKEENLVKEEEKEEQVAPTPNTDETAATAEKGEEEEERKGIAVNNTPTSGSKRKVPEGSSSSSPKPPSSASAKKKKKERPPDQPDIASFFSKKK